MLKMTKVELEKISDSEKHIFIKRVMKGDISCICTRFSIADNEYCPNYDKNKPKVYINYLDMNNFYGHAMSEYLPHGRFKWVKVNNEVVNRILNKSSTSLHGYLLEVHLDYPENLHDYHNDYPLSPEKIKIEDKMLSPFSSKIKKKHNIKTDSMIKLVPNLMAKEKYCTL